jgi:hypothetical protein
MPLGTAKVQTTGNGDFEPTKIDMKQPASRIFDGEVNILVSSLIITATWVGCTTIYDYVIILL